MAIILKSGKARRPSLPNIKTRGSVLLDCTNYNEWQAEQFCPYVSGKVLEIGCGLGNITQFLLPLADELLSVDIKPEAVEFLKSRLGGYENFLAKCINVFDPGVILPEIFDTVIFSNVLEHIDDDTGAMLRCHRFLEEKEGTLVLLVPAHGFFYGTLDQECGHRRRYSRSRIKELARTCFFEIKDLYAFNFVGGLGWWFNYCLLRRKNTNAGFSSDQVSFYDRFLVKPCRRLESILRPPVGISYVCIMKAKRCKKFW